MGQWQIWLGKWGPLLVYLYPAQTIGHFGTVASYDNLMQNFYKVSQGNSEKVPSFTTSLEGTLNQSSYNAQGG